VAQASLAASIVRIASLVTAEEPPSLDQLVDLLRVRLRDADALNASELHSFKELMSDHADVIADQWYWHAFEELDAQGHLDPAIGEGDGPRRLSSALG
jgi:hypothetical protein